MQNINIDMYRIPAKVLEFVHTFGIKGEAVQIVVSASLMSISVFNDALSEKAYDKMVKGLNDIIANLSSFNVYDGYSFELTKGDNFLIFNACRM